MQSIKIKRYTTPNGSWAGTIEPEDGAWIAFIPEGDGPPVIFKRVLAESADGQVSESYENAYPVA